MPRSVDLRRLRISPGQVLIKPVEQKEARAEPAHRRDKDTGIRIDQVNVVVQAVHRRHGAHRRDHHDHDRRGIHRALAGELIFGQYVSRRRAGK